MNITLRPATQRLLNRKLKSGRYSDADELVRSALKTLDQVDKDNEDETVAAVRRGIEQADRGELRPWRTIHAEMQERFFKKQRG